MAGTDSVRKTARFLSELPSPIKLGLFLIVVGGVGGIYYLLSQEGCSSRDLGEMGQHLERCGRVVVAGPEELLDLDAVEGCELIPASEHPDIEKALRGREEIPLRDAMREVNADKILVGVDERDKQLMPPPTLRHLLGTYVSLDHFHAVYLSQAAGLFEIVEPFRVSDRAGEDLVRVARSVLLDSEPPRRDSLSGEVHRRRDPEVRVAVALQGLRPISRSSRSVNFNRRDFYIIRSGDTLANATIEAAERIRERWEPTGTLEREGEISEALDHLTIEIEILYDVSPIELHRPATMGPMTYRRHLWNVVELGVHGLIGRHENEHVRYLLPSSAVYRARDDVDSFLRRMARNFDLNGDGDDDDGDESYYWRNPDFRVERFRTHHFREMEPRGQVRRLRRSFIPVDQDVVTEENVRESVQLAASWLENNQRDDGLYEYKYFPTRDSYYREFHPDHEDAHNIVRHGLAAYSMFMVAREFDDEDTWESAERAMQIMLDFTAVGPGWYEDEGRRVQLPERRRRACQRETECLLPEECIEGFCRLPWGVPVPGDGDRHTVNPSSQWESYDGVRRDIDPLMMFVRWKDVGKMGSVAAVVMAMTEAIAERPELLEQYRPFLEGYWRFLRFMQKSDGSFNHYFTVPSDVRYYSTETTIYPGEILFALSRIYRLLGDEEIRQAFDRGFDHYMEWFRREVQIENPDGTYNELRRNDLVAFVPWLTMATADMYDQHQEERYADAGVECSDWIARRYQFDPERTYYEAYMGSFYRVWWEQAAMHGIVYTEGTAAGFNLARRAGDDERAERLRRATLLGCRFAIQQIIRPGIDDAYLPGARARLRSRGCVRFSLTVPDCRTDYSYHSLSALVQALRYFRDADWEFPD